MKASLRLALLFLPITILLGCAPMQRMANSKIYEYSGRSASPNFSTARITTLDASGICWLMVNGEINADTVRAFRLAHNDIQSRKCGENWIFLQSPGGSVSAAIEIGKIIRNYQYNTTLEKGMGNCSSACGILFISGVKRELPVPLLEGKLGFHQPAVIRNGKKVCQPESSVASNAILNYATSVLSLSAAKAFHERVMATECTGIKSYPYAELVSAGIATKIGGPDVF